MPQFNELVVRVRPMLRVGNCVTGVLVPPSTTTTIHYHHTTTTLPPTTQTSTKPDAKLVPQPGHGDVHLGSRLLAVSHQRGDLVVVAEKCREVEGRPAEHRAELLGLRNHLSLHLVLKSVQPLVGDRALEVPAQGISDHRATAPQINAPLTSQPRGKAFPS